MSYRQEDEQLRQAHKQVEDAERLSHTTHQKSELTEKEQNIQRSNNRPDSEASEMGVHTSIAGDAGASAIGSVAISLLDDMMGSQAKRSEKKDKTSDKIPTNTLGYITLPEHNREEKKATEKPASYLQTNFNTQGIELDSAKKKEEQEKKAQQKLIEALQRKKEQEASKAHKQNPYYIDPMDIAAGRSSLNPLAPSPYSKSSQKKDDEDDKEGKLITLI